jgi:hypothetical protein
LRILMGLAIWSSKKGAECALFRMPMGTSGKDHGGIFKCITLHKVWRVEGLNFLRNGGVTYVTKHGVTEHRCYSDSDPDFLCTINWLAAHYFSTLR